MDVMFVQRGDAVDYTPGADVAAGSVVVQNELVGVAVRAMKANEPGSLAVAGVFDFPKATGLGTAIGVGLDVYWDEAASQATTNANAGANKRIGRSVLAATDDDATVRVRLD